MASINRSRVVVYINGVRFDPMAVSFSVTQGEAGTFSVQVPGIPEWDLLQPRAHGVVFFIDPVTKTWRLLGEGDYMGYNKTKSADGSRSRDLIFRTLHAVFDTIPYAAVTSIYAAPPGQGGAVDAVLRAVINGIRITPGGGAREGSPPRLFSFQQLLEAASDRNSRVSRFLPALVFAAVMQTPVDSFYFITRLLQAKMFALEDQEIARIIDFFRVQSLATEGFHSLGLNMNHKLRDAIKAYENLVFYQHNVIPAPPFLRRGTAVGFLSQVSDISPEGGRAVIPELMFMPHLYNVIPPRSNVIFADQIRSESVSRQYHLEPTRVVTQLHLPNNSSPSIPLYYLANSLEDGTVRALTSSESTTISALTHDAFSVEELTRGVFPRILPLSLERLGQGPSDTPDEDFAAYVSLATRHHLQVEQGRHRVAQLSCTFLPYILPGFPCLVEDHSGPYHGIVQQVAHMFTQEGSSTSVTVSTVREALYRTSRPRTAPLPSWLNQLFRPENINRTYETLLGPGSFASDVVGSSRPVNAMVPDELIEDASITVSAVDREDAPTQADLDRLAAAVIPVLKVGGDGSVEGREPSNYADRMRKASDAHAQMAKYQWRTGTTLSQYLSFHGLDVPLEGIDTATEPPHEIMRGSGPIPNLFAIPGALQYKDVSAEEAGTGGDDFGVYRAVSAANREKFMDSRVRASRLIARALRRGISRG